MCHISKVTLPIAPQSVVVVGLWDDWVVVAYGMVERSKEQNCPNNEGTSQLKGRCSSGAIGLANIVKGDNSTNNGHWWQLVGA